MTTPVPSHPAITTAYGVKGGKWSCGWHDGVDFGSQGVNGQPVVAAWHGTVVSVNFGSAFGTHVSIDHDHLPDGRAGGWGLYAHLSGKSVSVGQRVTAGQRVGTVGATGNTTGPHLHFGVYMTPYWTSGGGVNPDPWLKAGEAPAGGGCSEAYPHPTSGTVYLSKLRAGQTDSDSVWYLQRVLNDHTLQGGQTLPLTGCLLEETDEEVRLCQAQHGFGGDPPMQSFVGPSQAAHLFGGTGLVVVDDT